MKTDLVFRQDLGFQRQKTIWSTWNEHHFSFWQGPGGVGGHRGPIDQHGPIDQEHAQNHTAALEAQEKRRVRQKKVYLETLSTFEL